MDTKLLDKWLNGSHTADDLKQLETYPEFAAYRKIDAFTKLIELPEFKTEEALLDLKKIRSRSSKNKVRLLPTVLKIAAVLILFIASYVYINSISNTTHTTITDSKTISLPDSSTVILNKDSQLAYKDREWENDRALTLQGEAFFKVAKGKKFTVQTTKGSVEVLGTQFNVMATAKSFQVSCYEGIVAVYYNNEMFELRKGTRAIEHNGKLIFSDTFVSKPEWIGNESSFDNISISKVLKELEDEYAITVNTQNIDVTLRFTGSFTHNDLEAALQTITIPLGLKYTIENNKTVRISPEEN